MRTEVHDWLEQAHADLKTARDNLSLKNYYASVVFSQQSAEKALKALYFFSEKKVPPKIHDLVKLAMELNAPEEVLASADNLTGTYLSSRYPGAAPEIPARYYTQVKAETHLQEAEVILKWAEKKIIL